MAPFLELPGPRPKKGRIGRPWSRDRGGTRYLDIPAEVSPSVADYVITRSLGARNASSAPAIRQWQRNHITPFRGPCMSIDFGPLEELR